MSELPELPPTARRTRPLPPGGLDDAVRNGRRRRNRFLGATGGVATAAVLVLALTAAAPASQQSLQYADDPTPAPTASQGAEPAPAATASPDAQPAPAGSPDAQPSPGGAEPDPGRPDPSPDANAPAPAAGAPADRDAYTESPAERAAPATCRQPPTGSAGPVFYGGGSACVSASSSDSTVKRGGRVTGSIDICEPHGAGGARLGYDSGQEHEVTVTRGDRVVYRFSDTVRYEQGAHERVLGDGQCLVWTGVWDTTLADGSLAPAGSYRVRVSVRPDSIDGERTRPEHAGAVEFSVTVEE